MVCCLFMVVIVLFVLFCLMVSLLLFYAYSTGHIYVCVCVCVRVRTYVLACLYFLIDEGGGCNTNTHTFKGNFACAPTTRTRSS